MLIKYNMSLNKSESDNELLEQIDLDDDIEIITNDKIIPNCSSITDNNDSIFCDSALYIQICDCSQDHPSLSIMTTDKPFGDNKNGCFICQNNLIEIFLIDCFSDIRHFACIYCICRLTLCKYNNNCFSNCIKILINIVSIYIYVIINTLCHIFACITYPIFILIYAAWALFIPCYKLCNIIYRYNKRIATKINNNE